MADDFRVRVIAETQEAEKKLKQVDAAAEKVVKPRKLNLDVRSLSKNFSSLQRDIKSATNNIRTLYSISKKVPGLSDTVEKYEKLAKSTLATAKAGAGLKENAQAGGILANSLELVARNGSRVLDVLAKIGFATFALKEAVGVLQSAWNGFFNNTIGREIQLRETILKTQTTLASTNKVFANGKEITDPYQKIVALTGAVAERIDSIRERSIALAGVTSNEVIEVFGIVASQVGQIGGGLKEAEDLAINFAAALGTFGIPLYQAQQEIGSILRGDITTDSYLAKALGITNEDVARAKTQTGGVTKFLEDRLAAAVAGQRIAAEGFAGVVSNIADLGELIGQNFGRGLLDPLLSGLTAVFESLFRIRTQLFDIASGAGEAIGRAGQLIVGLTAGRTGLGAGDPSKAAAAAAAVAQRGFSELEQVAQRTVGALSQAIEALKPTALILVDAFKNIAEAFVRIKVGTFEALASALANIASVVGALAPSLATVFNIYARFLNTPAVRYFSEVAAVLGLLKRVGLDAVTQLALFGRFIFGSVIPAVGGLGTALGGLIAVIATTIAALGKLILLLASLATALVGPAAIIPAVAAALKALSLELVTIGKEAVFAGGKLNGLAAGFRGLGASAKAAGSSILASLGWVAAIQVGIAVLVDAFGRYQRAQENQRSTERAREALRRLQTTYKDVGNEADSATKSARDFELAIVNAEYDRAIRRLDEIKTKLQELRKDAEEFNVIQDFLKLFDVTRTFRGATGRSDFNQRRALVKEEAELRKQLAEVDAARDREQARKDIQLEAQNRVNLEREIADLRRQLDNDLFQQRQALAQKEVDIFRAAGELRIRQIEKANAKLIEGEEGASEAALEALNNYISTKERGELEIAAAQKTLAIEVANLERSIIDYRLDIERKIADLRKKSADYEKNAAEARAAAGEAPGVTAGFRVGSTGRSTGPHLDIRSPTNDKEAVLKEAFAIVKHWQKQGVEYIQLSNAKIDVKSMVDDDQLRAALRKEQEIHAKRSGGGAIDIAVPAGTLVPMPVGTPSWGGTGGWQATSLQTGNLFLHGLDTSVASPATNAAKPAATTPAGDSEIPDPAAAAARFEAAVRQYAGAAERYRSLQAALTEADTADAFERIAKDAFPRVALEQYDNQILELQGTLRALGDISAEVYDPEQIRIAVEQRTKELIAERERKQILEKAAEQLKKKNITQKEFDKLSADIAERQRKTTEDLQKEADKRRQILALTKQQNAVESLKRDTAAIRFDVARAGLQAQAAMAQSFAGDNALALRMIEAEQKIAERRLALEQDQTKTTEEITKELTGFVAETRAAAVNLAELDDRVVAFTTQMSLIRDVSKTLTDSYKGLAQSFLSGGALKDAVMQMSQAITDKLVGIVLDGAFKPMEDLFVKTLKDVFGMQDPTQALQEANNVALGQNTLALEKVTRALSAGGPTPLQVQPFAGMTGADLETMLAAQGQGAVEATLEQSFKGIGESLTQLGAVAETTGQQTDNAAKTGEKGFGKFLGAMTGVATGALAITGAIQAMQESENGTYGTLMGIAGILGGLGAITGGFAALGKRAAGGPVTANRPYIVGELGPELIIPGASGTVIPNNQLTATQNHVSRQKASTTRPLRVQYESQVINNIEYVTVEQHRKGMAEAAERGRTLTLSALQNSLKARRQTGLA